jgi:hypothetical protein
LGSLLCGKSGSAQKELARRDERAVEGLFRSSGIFYSKSLLFFAKIAKFKEYAALQFICI